MKKLLIFFLFFSVGYAQIEKNIAVYRGDSTVIEFKVNGNITTKGIIFVVKLSKSFSSPRLIQKNNLIAGGNADEITTTYSAPQTKVIVYLRPEDTQDLAPATYYYDIIAADPNNLATYQTFNYGKFSFTNGGDVQTPFDGTDLPENATRITTVSLANGSLQNEYAKWDTTLKAWVPSGVVPGSGSGDEFDSTFVYQALSGKADINHNHTGVYEPVKGADDNYVTDAEKIKLSNLSGTNTGDQDLSNYASKTATQTFTGLNTFSGNKTVFGTTMNDSVGIRGRLNVDGIAKTTQIQNTDTTTSLATADRYGIENKKVWQYAGTSASASYGFYNRSLFSLSSGMRLGSHYGFYQETDFGGTGGIMQPNIYGFYNKLIYSRSDTSAAGKFIYNYFADVAKTGIGSFGGQYYGYYSTISSGIINSIAYHFYGAGNYPSYFGGNVEIDGSLILDGDTVTTTESIIGTTETLDSLILDYWNDNLGGGTWDSTYAYQRIVALETSVSNLQDSISSFRTILNSILTALDTCGCSASTADNTPPLAPTSYTAIGGTSETQYVTTWTDPIASDLDSIRWYEGSSNDTTAMTWITSIAGGVQTYTRTGRTANTTYWSAIKAIDDSGNVSWFSNIDSATTTGGAAPDTGLYKFDAEDGLANVTVNGDSVVVSTEQVYAGSYSYKIKGNGTANGVYMTIGSFPVAQTDTLWLTYRIYIPANTSTTQGWMLNVLFGYAGDWMTFGSGCLQGSGDIISAWQFPFGTEVTTNFSTGAGHKIEIVFLEGTGANAHSRAYVDETQVYTASDGDATEKPTRIALGAYNWYMDVGDAIYFDDIIISNDRLPLD